MILFVSAATSDRLKPNMALSDPAQPWVVAIAAELTDLDGLTLADCCTDIRAEGRKIRDDAAETHGITSQHAARAGVPEIVALGFVCNLAAQARCVVGHGIDHAKRVIEGVLLRRGKDTRLWTRPGLTFIDTMIAATPFCKIPSATPRDDGAYKWPSLDEACELLNIMPARHGILHPRENLQRVKKLFSSLASAGAFEVPG